MAQRYCTNCGNELGPNDVFCASCGKPAHETAAVATPEANVEDGGAGTPMGFRGLGKDLADTVRGSARGMPSGRSRREEKRTDRDLGPEIGLLPDEAMEEAVRFMLQRGYVVDSRMSRTATFSRYSPPSVALGVVLLLLLILPGVLYLLFGGNTLRTSLHLTPTVTPDGHVAGCRAKVGGDRYGTAYGGPPDLVRWLETLPSPAR